MGGYGELYRICLDFWNCFNFAKLLSLNDGCLAKCYVIFVAKIKLLQLTEINAQMLSQITRKTHVNTPLHSSAAILNTLIR